MKSTGSAAPTLAGLRRELRRFAEARDWGQFHTPKNLAMALSVEAAELLECFQWLTPDQSARLAAVDRRAVEEEVADVLLYLLRLTDILDIDPLRAAQRKMKLNRRKYPVALSRGSARKYSRR